MSSIIDLTYPCFGVTAPGELNLRVYSDDMEASRVADLAAVATDRHAAGHDVVIACAETHTTDYPVATGLGWRDERLTLCHTNSLVMLTATLFEAWHRTDGPIDVIIDDVQSPRTGMGPEHNDARMTWWLTAARAGDIAKLTALTGLDYGIYTGGPPRTEAHPVTIWAGCRRRRNQSHGSSIQGGSPLIHSASSIVEVTVTGHRQGVVIAKARTTKLRIANPAKASATVTRATDGRRIWTAA